MVKHMSIIKDINGTDLEKFGGWLRNPEVYAQFHKGFNKNDRINLTPWKLEGRSYTREVVAYLPVRAPAWFRKSIGTDTIRVREFQCVTFEHANSAAPQTYSADISPRDVTAVLFTTQLCFFPPWKEVIPFLSVQLKYANSPGCSDKVKVEASLSCTAEGLPWLWVLHGAIEKIMLSQGRDNVTALIDFFQREVDSGALTEHTQALEDKAVQHHLADVSEAFSVEEEAEISRPLPSPEHGSPVPESPRSVYYDAEEDAFSIADVLSVKEAKQRKRSLLKRLLCCFSCCSSNSKEGAQPPSQVHLLE